jgi:outer membrane protein assembly factor BamB
MTGFQILISRPGPQSGHAPSGSLSGVLDLLVDGMNVTARVGESQTLPFLRDLAHAAVDLATHRKQRVTVPFYLYEDPWELGLQRDGAHALLSLFRGGSTPEVAVHERRIDGAELLAGLRAALDESLDRGGPALAGRADLACALDTLAATAAWPDGAPLPAATWRPLESPADAALGFGCDLLLRPPSGDSGSGVARSDLLPLLVRGRLRITVAGRTRELGETFVFLVAERLVDIAAQLVDADGRGAPLFRRFEAAGVHGAARLCEDGAIGLTLRRAGDGPGAVGETFPGLDARSLAAAVVALGKTLGRALAQQERGQGQNLRLASFRAAVRALSARLRPQRGLAPRLNDAPESYRAYALSARKPQPTQPAPLASSKLRFLPRWSATVPGVDLASTFLCGDRLVVTGSRELAALTRATGEVLWKRPVTRAVAVPTPGGLGRIHPDGLLQIHDYGTGEPTLAVRLAPKIGGAATGAVIHSPGLPKLLVVSEGERHLSAIDLVSGEVRWRHTLSRAGTCRVRRAGKLLIEASGDLHLSAIDVQSGDVVWRLCDDTPFHAAPLLDHDTLFAVASAPDATATGAASGRRARAKLLSIDAWSGQVRFDAPLPARLAVVGSPLLAGNTVVVVVRDERGLGLCAFDRATGAPRYQLAPGLCPLQTAWLGVDDAVFANTDQGELLGIDADTGETRFRLALSTGDGDGAPRRLEPVLRSGALFVPQREVHVVRPRDGERLGQVPCDLIPDLMRVDERCDVYIAEESGHLAAFGAGARLSLVRA